jgi:hypothetical protein
LHSLSGCYDITSCSPSLAESPCVSASTDDQTVENQRRELEAVADRHGWQIVHTFADEGISGAKSRDKRPALDALLKGVAHLEFDLVAREIRFLIVVGLSRCRDAVERIAEHPLEAAIPDRPLTPEEVESIGR